MDTIDFDSFRSLFPSSEQAARACWAALQVAKADRDDMIIELHLTKQQLSTAARHRHVVNPPVESTV